MYVNGYLTEGVRVVKVADQAIAAATDVVGAAVDLTQATGVVFLTSFGTAAANNTIKAQQSDTAGGAYADLAGTSVAVGASDEDVFLEIKRPLKRFVRPVVVRGTSTTSGDVWALVYGARTRPVTSAEAGTIAGEQHHSPAEGVA